jgi:hypothetical protein
MFSEKKQIIAVFVVMRHIIENCEEIEFDSSVFSSYEEALEHFNSIKKEERMQAKQKNWIIDTDTNEEFCAYDDGYYSDSHSCIQLTKHEISI